MLQKLPKHERSAAFPFELAYRLANMYSIKDDTILDAFLGTGTITFVAMATKRYSIGYEIDIGLRQTIENQMETSVDYTNKIIEKD